MIRINNRFYSGDLRVICIKNLTSKHKQLKIIFYGVGKRIIRFHDIENTMVSICIQEFELVNKLYNIYFENSKINNKKYSIFNNKLKLKTIYVKLFNHFNFVLTNHISEKKMIPLKYSTLNNFKLKLNIKMNLKIHKIPTYENQLLHNT